MQPFLKTFYWDFCGDFSDWATFPTFPTLFSSSTRKRNNNRAPKPRRCTASPIPLHNQNRQLDDYQIPIAGQACARYRHRGAYRSPPPRYRRPNRRPKYACCRNYNQAVALFCGVNALGRFLPVEPSPPRCATNLRISSSVWHIFSMSLNCLEDFHSLRRSVLFSGIFMRSLRLF